VTRYKFCLLAPVTLPPKCNLVSRCLMFQKWIRSLGREEPGSPATEIIHFRKMQGASTKNSYSEHFVERYVSRNVSGAQRDTRVICSILSTRLFSFCWSSRFFLRLKFLSPVFCSNTFHPDVCSCSRISVCTCFKLLTVQSLTNLRNTEIYFFFFWSALQPRPS
jgi:hypothetical protein